MTLVNMYWVLIQPFYVFNLRHVVSFDLNNVRVFKFTYKVFSVFHILFQHTISLNMPQNIPLYISQQVM